MTTLGSWLKEQGFTVDDNNVPYGRESEWHGVDFIVVHHTVSDCDGSESSIASYCRTGGSGTYPPLCQIMLGGSGKVWMTSKERSGQKDPGRASHAGSGNGYGVPTDSMNAYSLGIECQCDGSHKLSTHSTLYSTLIRLTAALCRRYDVPVGNVIGHKEWSSTGKVDPRDDMNKIRGDVAAEMEEPVSDNYDYDYLEKPGGTLTVAREYKTLDLSTWDPPRSGWESTYVYLNIKPTFKSGATVGALRVRLVREDGDTTGHHDEIIHKDALDSDGRTLRHWLYWEKGSKDTTTKVDLLCLGGLESVAISTRYTKKAVVVD